jgi:hypothetical protein
MTHYINFREVSHLGTLVELRERAHASLELQDHSIAMELTADGCTWLFARSGVWHTDADGKKYSALLCVANVNMQVESRVNRKDILTATVCPTPGDLIVLNIHQEHRAVSRRPYGSQTSDFSVWLIHDFDKEPTPAQLAKAFPKRLLKGESSVSTSVA